MQSIQCKTLPATNTKPTRLKVWCQAGSKTVSYDQGLNMTDARRKLITDFAIELDWLNDCSLSFGVLHNGDDVGVLTRSCGFEFKKLLTAFNELKSFENGNDDKLYYSTREKFSDALKTFLKDKTALRELGKTELVQLIGWCSSYRPHPPHSLLYIFSMTD